MLDLSRHNSQRSPPMLTLPAWELTFQPLLASSQFYPQHVLLSRIHHVLYLVLATLLPLLLLCADMYVCAEFMFDALDTVRPAKAAKDAHLVLRWVHLGSIFASLLLLVWDLMFVNDNRKNDRILDACLDYRLGLFHSLRSYTRWCIMRVVNRTRTWRSRMEAWGWIWSQDLVRVWLAESPKQIVYILMWLEFSSPSKLGWARSMKPLPWSAASPLTRAVCILAAISFFHWIIRCLLQLFALGLSVWLRFGLGLELADEIRRKLESRLWRVSDMEKQRSVENQRRLGRGGQQSSSADPFSRQTLGSRSPNAELLSPSATTSFYPVPMHRYQSYRSSLPDISQNIPAYLPDSIIPPSSINVLPPSHHPTGDHLSPRMEYEAMMLGHNEPSVASTSSTHQHGGMVAATRRGISSQQGGSLVSNAATMATPDSATRQLWFTQGAQPTSKTAQQANPDEAISVWPRPADLGMMPPPHETSSPRQSPWRFRFGYQRNNSRTAADDSGDGLGLTSEPVLKQKNQAKPLPSNTPKRRGWAWYRKKYRESLRQSRLEQANETTPPQVILTTPALFESPHPSYGYENGGRVVDGMLQMEEFDWGDAAPDSTRSSPQEPSPERPSQESTRKRQKTSGLQSAFASTNNSPASGWSRAQEAEDVPHVIDIPENASKTTLAPSNNPRRPQKSTQSSLTPQCRAVPDDALARHNSLSVPESLPSNASPGQSTQPNSQQSVYIFDFYKNYYSRSPPGPHEFILRDSLTVDSVANHVSAAGSDTDMYRWAATATVGRSVGTLDHRGWQPQSPPRPPLTYSEWQQHTRESTPTASPPVRALSFMPPAPEVVVGAGDSKHSSPEAYGVQTRSSGSIQRRSQNQQQSTVTKSTRKAIPDWWTDTSRFSPPQVEITVPSAPTSAGSSRVRDFSRPAFAPPRRPSQPSLQNASRSATAERIPVPPVSVAPLVQRKPSGEAIQAIAESWRHSVQIASPVMETPKILEYSGLESTFTTPVQSRRNSMEGPASLSGSFGPNGIPIPQVEVFDFDAMMLEREMRQLQQQQEASRMNLSGPGVVGGMVMTPDSGDQDGFSGGMLLETGSFVGDAQSLENSTGTSSDAKEAASAAPSWVPAALVRKKSVEGFASSARKLLTGIGKSSTTADINPVRPQEEKLRKQSAPAVVTDIALREALTKSKRKMGLI